MSGTSGSATTATPYDRCGAPASRRGWLSLALMACMAGALPVLAWASAGASTKVGSLKACGFMTSTAGGSSFENIKFVDTKAAGVEGTFVFEGTGVNETKRLTMTKNGIAFTSFAVPGPGTEMIKVKLATKPATLGTFHFTLLPTTGDVASKIGCKPR